MDGVALRSEPISCQENDEHSYNNQEGVLGVGDEGNEPVLQGIWAFVLGQTFEFLGKFFFIQVYQFIHFPTVRKQENFEQVLVILRERSEG